MKKQFLFIAFGLIAATSFSQSFKSEVAFGFAGTQVMGDNIAGYNKLGLYAGISVAHRLNDISDLVFELNYTEKGSSKLQRPKMGDYTIYKIKVNYIDIPLMYRRAYNDKLSFEGGLAFGVLVKESEEDENGVFPYSSPFSKYDISFILGASYQWKEKISINLRSSESIIPIRRFAGNNLYRFNKGQYNIVLIFGLRYSL